MEPTFFLDKHQFRTWLEKNHQTATELLVGFYKVKSGKASITWPESVDEALCFGWIDGIRKSIDESSYSIRFTPRRATSIWSARNLDRVEELLKQNLMQPAGIKAYQKRKESKSKIYGYEQKIHKLSEAYETAFKANSIAWEYFINQAPSYQKKIIHWIMSAKQEKTRLNRLQKTITASEAQKRLS